MLRETYTVRESVGRVKKLAEMGTDRPAGSSDYLESDNGKASVRPLGTGDFLSPCTGRGCSSKT